MAKKGRLLFGGAPYDPVVAAPPPPVIPPDVQSKHDAKEAKKKQRDDAGFVLVEGYPVVFNEHYVVGNFDYFCDKDTPAGMVYRKQIK